MYRYVQVSTWMFNLKFKGLCVYPYILPNTNESMVSYHPHGVATFRDLHKTPHIFLRFRNVPWASWHNEMCRNSHDKYGSCQLQVGASLPCSVEGGPYNLHADLVDRRFLQSSVISFCNFCNDHVFRHSLNHPELVQDFSHEQYVSNLLYSIVVAPKECQGNVLPIWSLQIMNKAEDCAMVFQAIASPPITANSRICLVRILTIRHRHPSSFETINHHQQQQQLSWIFSPSNKISLNIPFKKVSNITESTTTWYLMNKISALRGEIPHLLICRKGSKVVQVEVSCCTSEASRCVQLRRGENPSWKPWVLVQPVRYCNKNIEDICWSCGRETGPIHIPVLLKTLLMRVLSLLKMLLHHLNTNIWIRIWTLNVS